MGMVNVLPGGPDVDNSPDPDAGSEASVPPTEPAPVPPEADRSKEFNLLGDGFKFMPGTERDGNGWKFTGHGNAIRRKVGTDRFATPADYISNPPILRAGNHIKNNGKDFVLAGRIADIDPDATATLSLLSAPDIVFDEERRPFPGVSVSISQKGIVVSAHNGGKPVEQKIAFTTPSARRDFWVKQIGNVITIGSGDQQVAINANLFAKTGSVWFGLDGTKGKQFTLEQLNAYPANGNEIAVQTQLELGKFNPNDPQSLQALVGDGVLLGTAVDLTPLAIYPEYAKLVGQQVGAIKPEMASKPQAFLPGGPDKDGNLKDSDFVWQETDALVELAKRSGKKVHFHTILFGEALSADTEAFLQAGAEGRVSQEAVDNFIMQLVTKVVERYKDDVEAFDIINEPLMDYSDNEGEGFDLATGRIYRENAWFKATKGPRYIELGCKAAKAAGAKTVVVNEFGCEGDDDRAKALEDIAVPLKKKGYLDAIGLQSHIDEYDLENWREEEDNNKLQEGYVFDDISARIAQFTRHGLGVYISELTVDASERDQAIFCAGLFRAIKHLNAGGKKNVRGVYWWGLANHDAYVSVPEGPNTEAPWGWKNGKPVAKEVIAAIKSGWRR
jgi:endo-1,4-beta-xylanase